MNDKTEIINPKTASELVSAYEQAGRDIAAGYALLQKAKDDLKVAFGENCYMEPIDRQCDSYKVAENTVHIMDKIRRRAWSRIIDMIGIKKLLSSSRADELSKTIESGKMPELTVPEIYRMLEDLQGSAKNLLTEAVQEVYDYLRCGKGTPWHEYKTNTKNARFEVKDKVILTGTVHNNFNGGYSVNYGQYSETKLVALDKVFYALDGKGVPGGYRSPIVDAINTTKTGQGQTDYFDFKVYQNGNLHLTFRRPDLVKQLNAIAADHTTLSGV